MIYLIIIKMFVESKEKPTTGHVVLVAINIMLVVMSCGFVLGGNSCIGDVLAIQLEWGDQADKNNTYMSTAAILGLMIGSIGSKFLTNCGRRRAILLSYLVIIIATVPSFFSSNFWVLLMSRLIMGIPAAVCVNAGSLY